MVLYSEGVILQNARRQVKRRQALKECNLPGNSQMKADHLDEQGRGPEGSRPHHNRVQPHSSFDVNSQDEWHQKSARSALRVALALVKSWGGQHDITLVSREQSENTCRQRTYVRLLTSKN